MQIATSLIAGIFTIASIAGVLATSPHTVGQLDVWQFQPSHWNNYMQTSSAEADVSDEAELIEDSIEVLEELTSTPDDAIPQHLLARAEAIVVIPSLVKGGFIVGAKHGEGILSVRNPSDSNWSAPAFMNMTGMTIGWQIGLESVDLVLLVMNKDGMNRLLEDRFTLGASASVTAGPVGRSVDAGTNASLDAEILAYSRAKGLFAGATLDGAALHSDGDANEDFYGKRQSTRQIVAGAVDRLPPMAAKWRATLARIVRAT
jgi:lipid-binding SYLF domain-containing protein